MGGQRQGVVWEVKTDGMPRREAVPLHAPESAPVRLLHALPVTQLRGPHSSFCSATSSWPARPRRALLAGSGARSAAGGCVAASASAQPAPRTSCACMTLPWRRWRS
jgi:hypothetical protein